MDNLTLSYKGNQLIKADDSAPDPTLFSRNFRDVKGSSIEYTYDANGNLTKDLNKGITKIQYNLLNLPKKVNLKKVSFNPAGHLENEYTYAVDGSKLRVNHKKSSGGKVTDYVGNMIYEGGSLKRILVDGGFYEEGKYYFYLKDHLGNNRVVADASGNAIQVKHYYPFGMSFTEGFEQDIKPAKQLYKYNGKELDGENSLNWYDYETRQLTLDVPRFTTVNPLAEKHYSISPYVYCANNPVNAIDPDGKLPVFLIPLVKGTVGAIVDAAAQVTISMANGQGFGEAMSNIDYTSIGSSFVTSALTMPGMSTAAKTATVATITLDAVVDISSRKGVETVVTGEKEIVNAAVDISSSVLPGKAVDRITSGFNQAVASDLTATSAATMTKGTKSGLKQAQSIVNSTGVQIGANVVGDFIGGLAGGQVNTSVNSSGGSTKPVSTSKSVNQFVQPADAINVQKPLYPFIIQR